MSASHPLSRKTIYSILSILQLWEGNLIFALVAELARLLTKNDYMREMTEAFMALHGAVGFAAMQIGTNASNAGKIRVYTHYNTNCC